jgi:hypothetical protein
MNNLFCEGSLKSKVYFYQNGVRKDLEIQKSPFRIEHYPNLTPCGKLGTINYSYTTSKNDSNCNGSDSITEVGQGSQLFFKSRPSSNTFDGNIYDLWIRCGFEEKSLISNFSIQCGEPTIISQSFTPDLSKGLFVFDENGSLIARVDADATPYKVDCGDCPPGSIKCKCSHYPGYCCIPCQETVNKVNNIAAKIKI